MIVNIPLADKRVAIHYSDASLTPRFKENYVLCEEKTPLLCRIFIQQKRVLSGFALYVETDRTGVVEVGKRHKKVPFRTVNFFLKALIQFFALREKTVLLHASSIANENKAYVFLGRSGAGKSTVLRFARGFDILADDTAIIKKDVAEYLIYPSPFDRKKRPEIGAKAVRVKKLYTLHKSSLTRVEPVEKHEAIKQLLSCSFLQEYFNLIAQNPRLAVSTASHRQLRKALEDLAGKVPVFNMKFRKNPDCMDLLI